MQIILLSRFSTWKKRVHKTTCSPPHCYSTETLFCDPIWGNHSKWIKIFYLMSQNLARRMCLEGIKTIPVQTKINFFHTLFLVVCHIAWFSTCTHTKKSFSCIFQTASVWIVIYFYPVFTCREPSVIFCREQNHFWFNSFSTSPQKAHQEGTRKSRLTQNMI